MVAQFDRALARRTYLTGGLRWSSAVSASRAQVYFFDDNQGIDLPASWSLQYRNGSAYVNVPGASGYPVVAKQYNTVTFTPVSVRLLSVRKGTFLTPGR
ncbi:MAG TPA: hypothetical protein VFY84_00105 [Jiangellales bacterium]|nr:hypothetical protein [Jiangellales bacterium]